MPTAVSPQVMNDLAAESRDSCTKLKALAAKMAHQNYKPDLQYVETPEKLK